MIDDLFYQDASKDANAHQASKSPSAPRPTRHQVSWAVLLWRSPGLPKKRETCSSLLRVRAQTEVSRN
ncbi:MAG: hypothetical protein EBU26_16065 [Verrucomicrobia bacterium]|nr:hypothetical protein [Verrucomicrobiota bacterium]